MKNTMKLLHPIATEKAVKLIEAENKLTFVVDLRATKKGIKREFEEKFKIKPISINTQIKNSRKIAYIKLKAENPAIDVATKLGLM